MRPKSNFLFEGVPAAVPHALQSFEHSGDVCRAFAQGLVEVEGDGLFVGYRSVSHLTREVGVDVVELHVPDAARRQLQHVQRICAGEREMSNVEADACFGADQQALDVFWSLNRAAESRLHRELQLVARAHVLDGADEVQQVGPLRVREGRALTSWAIALWDG